MPLLPKPLPSASLTLLFFPQRDTEYVHFQEADTIRFEHLSTAFSAINA